MFTHHLPAHGVGRSVRFAASNCVRPQSHPSLPKAILKRSLGICIAAPRTTDSTQHIQRVCRGNLLPYASSRTSHIHTACIHPINHTHTQSRYVHSGNALYSPYTQKPVQRHSRTQAPGIRLPSQYTDTQSRLMYSTRPAPRRQREDNREQASNSHGDAPSSGPETQTCVKSGKRFGTGSGRKRKSNKHTYAKIMAEDHLWSHFYGKACQTTLTGTHAGIKAYVESAYTEEIPEHIPEYAPHRGGGSFDALSIYEKDVDWKPDMAVGQKKTHESITPKGEEAVQDGAGSGPETAGQVHENGQKEVQPSGRIPTMRDKYTALHCILEALTCKAPEGPTRTHVNVPEVLSLAKSAIEKSFEMGVAPRTPHYNHLLHFCAREEQVDFTVVQHLGTSHYYPDAS
ncbi:hypothetical protein SARC_10177 [Sphaeroforma arctica JP610]|uniref:Uncharacterized protein n=1 Tax=Sphaeroforma arctica JP610 TaxID=667725 RepID=A0A0L0FMT2_9EUKA|nr:hypothetical protein SARC_10177 [Sphaeroforma arctica JP610]KNC77358.1 hypothetical protein SARC_10177 [Sphaeroforma arctica JP610]|eukprot:XP_014151260.1 hypothetical protein SARC_10177 [Sphaeroforma arctica JP610]